MPCEHIHKEFADKNHHLTVGFVYEGIKEVCYNGRIYRFCPGEFFCLGLAAYGVTNHPNEVGEYEEVSISFSHEELAAIKLSDMPIVCPHANNHCGIESLILVDGGFAGSDMREIFDDLRYNRRLHALSITKRRATLTMLLGARRGEIIAQTIINSLDGRLSIVENTLRTHIFHNYTIEELAKMCHLSTTNFKRMCLVKYGTSPHRWILEKRIERARLQLQFTNASIATIALGCGFKDASYFVKVFKRYVGLTPRRYRGDFSTVSTVA